MADRKDKAPPKAKTESASSARRFRSLENALTRAADSLGILVPATEQRRGTGSKTAAEGIARTRLLTVANEGGAGLFQMPLCRWALSTPQRRTHSRAPQGSGRPQCVACPILLIMLRLRCPWWAHPMSLSRYDAATTAELPTRRKLEVGCNDAPRKYNQGSPLAAI